MRNRTLAFSIIFFGSIILAAQTALAQEPPAKSGKPAELNKMVFTDSSITTRNEITIKGQRVPYTVNAGTMPVWDDEGKPMASVFYTYYERSDIKDRSSRPLIISFNGGPGTPSVWMEIGFTGPRILNVDDEGYPVQPYGLRDNSNSILDMADIVYVDPVNTGFQDL